MRTLFRTTAAVLIAAVLLTTGLLVVGSTSAGAVHAGESITVSQTSGLADGTTVQVTVSGFTPGARPVKLVIAGQGSLVTIPDKLNFDEYAVAPEVPIGPDGSGSAEFLVTADHGTVQDGTTLDCNVNQCWLIAVQEPFLPQPNYASQEIFFGTNGPATTAAPAPTDAPPVTEASTTTEATTTTTEATTTTIDGEELAATAEDDEGGSSGLLFVIIAVVVVAVGAGGYYFTKKKPAAG